MAPTAAVNSRHRAGDPARDRRLAGPGRLLRQEAHGDRQEAARAVAKCFSAGAKKGVAADPACVTKAGGSFNSSLKACGTPTQLAPVEELVDQFSIESQSPADRTRRPPRRPPRRARRRRRPRRRSASTSRSRRRAGTANCGSNQFSTPADPPFSGELDSDTVGDQARRPRPRLPLHRRRRGDGEPVGHSRECHDGPRQPRRHDAGGEPGHEPGGLLAWGRRAPPSTASTTRQVECTADADCFAPGGCQTDPTCYFGPPVLVNGFPSSCVVNAFAQNASGTLNTATGAVERSISSWRRSST